MKKIAVIGSNNMDLMSYIHRMPEEGETLQMASFEMGFGGKGANQAVAAAKLGAEVVMLSTIGDDLFGTQVKQNLENMGIDTRFVRTVLDSSNGVAPIFVLPDSSNRILIHQGANAALSKQDIENAASVLKQECGLLVLQLEIDLQTVYAAIDFGDAHKIPVLLNPAPALKDLDLIALRKLDFLVPNETELATMTNMAVSTIEEIRLAGQRLIDQGVKNVIVTMGKKGALWLNQTQVVHVDCPMVDAQDTSGAGDAFIGAFACYFAQQKPILEALSLAAHYASLSTCSRGTQKSYADLAAFHLFLETCA